MASKMTQFEEETVDQIAKLYDRHDRRTTRVQRLANKVTVALGRPVSFVVICALAVAWVTGNYVARSLGSTALEEFPIPDLGFIATIAALLVALLILTTQRHEQELAESRAQLTLHLALMSERKIAKFIKLMEEQRRDNPLLPSRQDHEAADMALPADAETTLSLIDEVAQERQNNPDE